MAPRTSAELDALEASLPPANAPVAPQDDGDIWSRAAAPAPVAPEPTPPPDSADTLGGTGVVGGLLSRAEAFAGGATLGLSDIASNLVQGVVAESSGYQGPRTTQPGLDAPVLDQSNFRQGYQQSLDNRADRRDELGGEGIGWSMLGAALPTLVSGGGTTLAGVAAKAPTALLDRAGASVASKLLGQAAAQTALKTVGARAAAGALEGGISSAISAAGDLAPKFVDDPTGAASDLAMAAGIGVGFGAGAGALFGLGEGVFRASRKALQNVDLAPKKVLPDAPRTVTPDEAVAIAAKRPLTSAELPNPERDTFTTRMALHGALRGDTDEAIAAGTRAIKADVDEALQIGRQVIEQDLGLATKRAVNKAAAAGEIALDPTSVLDEVDVEKAAKWAEITKSVDEAKGALTAHDNLLSATEQSLKAAQDTEQAQAAALADLTKRKPVGDDSAVQAARAKLQAAKEALAGTEPTVAPKAKGEKAQTNPILKDRQREVREADKALQRLTKAATQADESQAVQAAREALKAKQADVKRLQSEFAAYQKQRTSIAQRAAEVEGQAAKAERFIGEPRNLTKVEVETRGMFKGMLEAVDEMTAGLNQVESGKAGYGQLRKALEGEQRLATQAMREGRLEDAYNHIDQGAKRAIANFVKKNSGDSVAETFGQGLYATPQQFLENASVWGPTISGVQKTINPPAHTAMRVKQNSKWRAYEYVSDAADVDNWGNAKKVNDATIKSLLGQIGEAGTDSNEAALRTVMRAELNDVATRLKVLGAEAPPGTAERVARYAQLVTKVEDTLDAVALSRRDMKTAQQLMEDSKLKLAFTAAAAPLLTGIGYAVGGGDVGAALGAAGSVIGMTAVGSRYLVGTVAKYRGDVLQKLVKSAIKVASGLEKTAEFGARRAPRGIAKLVLSATERDRMLTDAQQMTTLGSDRMDQMLTDAQKVYKVDPQMAEAMVQQEGRAAAHIVSKLPQPANNSPFSGPAYLPPAKRASLDRTLIALKDPKALLERSARGHATNEDLDAFRSVWPENYEKFRAAVRAEIDATPSAKRTAAHKAYLGRILGEPITPALERMADIQKRAAAASHAAEDNGKPMDGGDGVTPRAPMRIDAQKVYGNRADRILAGS